MSIWQKILKAQKAIGYVPKNGKNTFHKYDYAMEADILDTVKTAANEAGLVLMTATTSEIGSYQIEKGSNFPPEVVRWAKVTLHYSVIDAETGDKAEGTFDGYAEDKGDKAIYKATTGANKYFLMKFFGVATGDDPERDEADKPQAKPTSPRMQKHQQRVEKTLEAVGDPEDLERKMLINKIAKLMNAASITQQQLSDWAGVTTVKGINDLFTLQGILNDLQRHLQAG